MLRIVKLIKTEYRGYIISGFALLVNGIPDEWFCPLGYVDQMKPGGQTVQIVHLQSKNIFKSQQAAEEKATTLCRQWIDEQSARRAHKRQD